MLRDAFLAASSLSEISSIRSGQVSIARASHPRQSSSKLAAVFGGVAIQPTVEAAFAMINKGSDVVIVGVQAKPVTVDFPPLQDQQINLQGAATYLAEDYQRAMEIMVFGAVDAELMVTSEYPAEDPTQEFAASTSGNQVKVLVRRWAGAHHHILVSWRARILIPRDNRDTDCCSPAQRKCDAP